MTLQIHAGRQHFLGKGGEPFFWMGDTAWELFHRCDRADAEHYLRIRARQGFTLIQAVALAELDGLQTPNANGDLPLIDLDPLRPNEAYFAHVDWIVRLCNELGMIVGFLPTWGDKWQPRRGAGPVVFTPENAAGFGRWLGERYRTADLVWILGGDRGVADETELQIIRAMAEGLREGDDGAHLMTFHPPGGRSSSRYVHSEAWIDFHMIQSGHSRERHNIPMIEHDREMLPRRPVVEGEPGYEAHPNQFRPENGWLDHHDIRRECYWALLTGAAGFTYGCHAVWQMWQPGRRPVNHPRAPWKESLLLPGATQMVHARNLFESLPPAWTREPCPQMLRSPQCPGIEQIRVARCREGTHALAYLPNAQRFTLDTTLLAGKLLHVSWFNPRNGRMTPNGETKPDTDTVFQCPFDSDGRDWVLVLEARQPASLP